MSSLSVLRKSWHEIYQHADVCFYQLSSVCVLLVWERGHFKWLLWSHRYGFRLETNNNITQWFPKWGFSSARRPNEWGEIRDRVFCWGLNQDKTQIFSTNFLPGSSLSFKGHFCASRQFLESVKSNESTAKNKIKFLWLFPTQTYIN